MNYSVLFIVNWHRVDMIALSVAWVLHLFYSLDRRENIWVACNKLVLAGFIKGGRRFPFDPGVRLPWKPFARRTFGDLIQFGKGLRGFTKENIVNFVQRLFQKRPVFHKLFRADSCLDVVKLVVGQIVLLGQKLVQWSQLIQFADSLGIILNEDLANLGPNFSHYLNRLGLSHYLNRLLDWRVPKYQILMRPAFYQDTPSFQIRRSLADKNVWCGDIGSLGWNYSRGCQNLRRSC